MGPDRNRGFWDIWFQKFIIDTQIACQNELFYHVLLFLKSIGHYIHFSGHWAHSCTQKWRNSKKKIVSQTIVFHNMPQTDWIYSKFDLQWLFSYYHGSLSCMNAFLITTITKWGLRIKSSMFLGIDHFDAILRLDISESGRWFWKWIESMSKVKYRLILMILYLLWLGRPIIFV